MRRKFSFRDAISAARPGRVVLACAVCAAATGAFAGDRRAPVDPCAAFGPGFAPLSGSSACVKIGGRVRVEAGMSRGLADWRVAPQAGAASGAAMPAFAAPHAGGQHRLRPARNF